MPRWPCSTTDERKQLKAKALKQLNGTLIPGDRVLAGKLEFVVEAEKATALSERAIYAAVNTMSAQPWMMHIDGQPVTLASSAAHWLASQRHEEAQEHRSLIDWATYGKRGGRPVK